MSVAMYNCRRYVKHMAESQTDRVLLVAKLCGVLRPRDLAPHGIARQYLLMAMNEGKIKRVGRGLYVAADAKITEAHSLAQACKRIPHGVVCLLSALRFHDLATQAPFEVWMAIGVKARLPKTDYPRLRIVRFSERILAYGVTKHTVEGVPVKVFTPAKTVADCFRYRNKIGTDVALEALRDCYRKRKATLDQIWEAAKVCRVKNVIGPYMESLT